MGEHWILWRPRAGGGDRGHDTTRTSLGPTGAPARRGVPELGRLGDLAPWGGDTCRRAGRLVRLPRPHVDVVGLAPLAGGTAVADIHATYILTYRSARESRDTKTVQTHQIA